jgi:hypothetical protein
VPPIKTDGSYGWPLKPFGRQHPVRGYLNDPRIPDAAHKSFHFGVDICGPDGTPVFAVEGGVAHLGSPTVVAVVSSVAPRTFGYWHIVPAVKHRQRVARHQLLGHIAAGWGHVHFAEKGRGPHRNPLRRGALEPFEDFQPPTVSKITFSRHGKAVPRTAVAGRVDVIVDAFDTPALPAPAPFNGMPVAPVRLRWRVLHRRSTVVPWRTPINLGPAKLPDSQFDRVYAPGTRQNHPNRPGRLRFYLARGWDTTRHADGTYLFEVAAIDVRGNRADRGFTFTIANRV